MLIMVHMCEEKCVPFKVFFAFDFFYSFHFAHCCVRRVAQYVFPSYVVRHFDESFKFDLDFLYSNKNQKKKNLKWWKTTQISDS